MLGNNKIILSLLRMVTGFDLYNSMCLKFYRSPFLLQFETIIIVHKLQSDVAS